MFGLLQLNLSLCVGSRVGSAPDALSPEGSSESELVGGTDVRVELEVSNAVGAAEILTVGASVLVGIRTTGPLDVFDGCEVGFVTENEGHGEGPGDDLPEVSVGSVVGTDVGPTIDNIVGVEVGLLTLIFVDQEGTDVG